MTIPQTDGGYTDSESKDLDDSSNDSNKNSGIKIVNEEYGIPLLLTNARSLLPKLHALKESFQSLSLNFSITETWFKGANLSGEIGGRCGPGVRHRLVPIQAASPKAHQERVRDNVCNWACGED